MSERPKDQLIAICREFGASKLEEGPASNSRHTSIVTIYGLSSEGIERVNAWADANLPDPGPMIVFK